MVEENQLDSRDSQCQVGTAGLGLIGVLTGGGRGLTSQQDPRTQTGDADRLVLCPHIYYVQPHKIAEVDLENVNFTWLSLITKKVRPFQLYNILEEAKLGRQ